MQRIKTYRLKKLIEAITSSVEYCESRAPKGYTASEEFIVRMVIANLKADLGEDFSHAEGLINSLLDILCELEIFVEEPNE
jgi:hypothetical protein